MRTLRSPFFVGLGSFSNRRFGSFPHETPGCLFSPSLSLSFLPFSAKTTTPNLFSNNLLSNSQLTMTSRDATRSNGARFRQLHDRELVHISEHDSAPEWGNWFTCVACWEHGITDLVRHRSQFCDDWNALNRLNCGFQRQHKEGRAPLEQDGSYPTKAYVLKGEHYRMVKARYGVQPFHIMRWQHEDFGPYDSLRVPHGNHMIFQGISYWTLLVETISSMPPSIGTCPRQCVCSRALARSRNGTSRSYFHEMNAIDELNSQAAVGLFMDANPFLIQHYENQMQGILLGHGPTWNQTQPFFARQVPQPLGGQGVWVDLAPQNQGICGVGANGIANTNETHFNQHAANALTGALQTHMNLYHNKTQEDARRGNFTMPGTPHH